MRDGCGCEVPGVSLAKNLSVGQLAVEPANEENINDCTIWELSSGSAESVMPSAQPSG